MRLATILVAVLALAPLANTTAQQQPPLPEPGARIRLQHCGSLPGTPRCERYEGVFVALTADSLVLESGAVSRASVTKLEVRNPHDVRNTVVGAVVGGVAGALLGGLGQAMEAQRECESVRVYPIGDLLYPSEGGPPYDEYRCETGGNDFAMNVVGSAVSGAVLGAIIGWLQRWQEVPTDRLQVSLGPQRDGRFGIGGSLNF